MNKDTIIAFKTPEEERADPLTELLRTGAQQLIGNAVEDELLELLEYYAGIKDAQGRPNDCAQRLPAGARDSDRHLGRKGEGTRRCVTAVALAFAFIPACCHLT